MNRTLLLPVLAVALGCAGVAWAMPEAGIRIDPSEVQDGLHVVDLGKLSPETADEEGVSDKVHQFVSDHGHDDEDGNAFYKRIGIIVAGIAAYFAVLSYVFHLADKVRHASRFAAAVC